MDKKALERRIEAAEKQLRTNLESVEKKLIDLQNDITNFKAKLYEVHDEEIPDFPVFKNHENAFFCDSNELYERFHTEEYADEFAKKCKLIAMMLHCKWYLDRDYFPDWGNPDENKFCLIFNHSKHKFEIDVWQTVDHNGVYFSTSEKAERCADWLNKHWKENTNE